MAASADVRRGIEVGDHVYVHHAQRGAMAVKVLACGRDGFTGRCERKQRHQLGYAAYVGHKARSTPAYSIVDQGADGALVEDGDGKRRYLSGHTAPASEPVDAGSPDDPLTDRMGVLSKADGLHLAAGVDKDGHVIHRWRGTPVFPQPQRMVDATHADYAPGGRYLAMPDRRDITGQTVDRARIAVGDDGKPSLEVSASPGEPSGATHGKVVRVNLFKQRAGWNWTHRADGTPDVSTIVSVEHGGRHHYALAAEFPHGVTLARYADKPNEPRLRPTTHGHVELGPVVGRLSVRGREHPVHRTISVQHKAGTLAKAMHFAGLVPVHVEDSMHMTPSLILFLKGGPVANRPGLALKRVTDRAGHQTQRWTKTGVDMPAAKPGASAPERAAGSIGRFHGDTTKPLPERTPEEQARYGQKKAADKAAGLPGWDEAPAFKEPVGAGGGRDPNAPPMKHGDTVSFRHGDVQGSGKIVASGADGVTVHDGEREHQIRHDALQGPVATPAGNDQAAGEPSPGGGDTQKAPPNPPPLFDHEQMAGLPDKAPQPFKDEDTLYKASGEALGVLKKWLDEGKGVCSRMGYKTMAGGMDDVDWSQPGGMLFIAPLKGKKRAGEKVAADYGGDWSQLKDVVRCSIAVDTMDDIQDAIAQLNKSGMVLAQKPKDRFNKPLPVGYRDCMMSVKFPNGCIGEVQIHLKTMLKAKEQGHKPYEVMRDIDAKPRDQWSAEDSAAYQKAEDDSKAIYGAAWAQSAGATSAAAPKGQGSTFGKALSSEEAVAWEFFDREGAKFRRPGGKPGGVTDVLQDANWKPYKGNRTDAYLYGDPIADPMGGGGQAMNKAMALFFKATIRGGAAGDLFAAPVHVAGHTTAHGTYVAPYTANRLKAPERQAPAPTPAPTPAPAPAVGGDTDERAAKLAKLAKLANYGTRYEVTAHPADGTKHLLGYTGNKSGKGLRDMVRAYWKELGPALGLNDETRMTMVGTDAVDLTGGHSVRFSGRTQRSAINDGEVAHISKAKPVEQRAKDEAAMMALIPKGKPTAPDAADWRDEENWHSRTQAKMKTHTDDALRFIAKDAAAASGAIDGIGGSKAGQYADEAHYANMELNARKTEANDAKLLEGLPAGAAFSEGKGPLGSGQWAVKVDGKAVWNNEATKEEAARVAKVKLAERGKEAVATAASGVRDKKIGMTLTAGGDMTDDDLLHLGLRTRKMSEFSYLSDAVQRAFGVNNRKVREAMGDALRRRTSDGGTAIWMANPRTALFNAARFYADAAEAKVVQPVPSRRKTAAEAKAEQMAAYEAHTAAMAVAGPIAQAAAEARERARIKKEVAGMYRVKQFETQELGAPKPPPAPDWRDEENWHARTQAKMKGHSEAELRFIAKDAAEASRAMDSIGSKKAGQYADEAHYANMELNARASATKDPKAIPDAIKAKVKGLVSGLHEVRQRMNDAMVADDKFGGAGRYENDVLANRRGDINRLTAGLADLRTKAAKLGLVEQLEAEIMAAGGAPSLDLSERGRRYGEDGADAKPKKTVLAGLAAPGPNDAATLAALPPHLAALATKMEASRAGQAGEPRSTMVERPAWPPLANEPAPDAKHFYVSAVDGSKRHLVAGPYGSHDEAKSMVQHVSRHASRMQPETAMSKVWGTAGSAEPIKTPLGENWKPEA